MRRRGELTREWTGGDKGTSRLRTEVLKGRVLIMKRLGKKVTDARRKGPGRQESSRRAHLRSLQTMSPPRQRPHGVHGGSPWAAWGQTHSQERGSGERAGSEEPGPRKERLEGLGGPAGSGRGA